MAPALSGTLHSTSLVPLPAYCFHFPCHWTWVREGVSLRVSWRLLMQRTQPASLLSWWVYTGVLYGEQGRLKSVSTCLLPVGAWVVWSSAWCLLGRPCTEQMLMFLLVQEGKGSGSKLEAQTQNFCPVGSCLGDGVGCGRHREPIIRPHKLGMKHLQSSHPCPLARQPAGLGIVGWNEMHGAPGRPCK